MEQRTSRRNRRRRINRRFQYINDRRRRCSPSLKIILRACYRRRSRMVDYGNEERKSRFVCPSDRQLALRAKLKTGWSVKTGHQTPQPPLGADEQAAILEVIKRAEQIELSEQERVGRLIERLEHLRRSALGRNSSQCLLCGEVFGILGAQKALCFDCRQFVCQKCAVEGCAGRTQHSGKEQWLCMICAETREIWKKSGAWFFKSIPKYVLPSQKGAITKSRSVRNSKKKGISSRDDDSSSEDERRPWSRIERRNSGTESTYEQQKDQTHSLSFSRQASSTDSQLSKETETLRNYRSSMTLSEARSWEGTMSDVRTDGETISEYSRRESIASRSLSDWNCNEAARADEKISPVACSTASSLFKQTVSPAETKHTDASLGIVELSLTYNPETNTLHCTVYRAKNLIPMDINGLADPFCKLNILPNAKTSTRLRTKTVHKTRNPEFNENLTFYDVSEMDLKTKALHILVVDDDKYGHDYMGEARIPLAKLEMQNTIYLRLSLEDLRVEQKGPLPAPEMNQWFDDLWSRGQILLSLLYSTKKRALIVTVIRCANLLPMDNNGFSDPFVKLQLRPDPTFRKYKTSIKWKNLNPVYNEEFTFETRLTDLSTQSLYLTVWDKDYGKSNDYLGGLILGGVGSKGQRLKHWLDMIHYPDRTHKLWHNLTEDQIMD